MEHFVKFKLWPTGEEVILPNPKETRQFAKLRIEHSFLDETGILLYPCKLGEDIYVLHEPLQELRTMPPLPMEKQKESTQKTFNDTVRGLLLELGVKFDD
jgi:hypothetical protein